MSHETMVNSTYKTSPHASSLACYSTWYKIISHLCYLSRCNVFTLHLLLHNFWSVPSWLLLVNRGMSPSWNYLWIAPPLRVGCLVPPPPVYGSCLRRQGEGRSLEVSSRVSYAFTHFMPFLAAEFLVSYGVFSIYRGFYITSEQSRLFIHHLYLVSQATPFAKGRDSDYWLILSRKQNSCYVGGQGEGSFYSLVPRLLFFQRAQKMIHIQDCIVRGWGQG